MKEFNLRRLVPVTAASSLLLGACGNSVEDNDDSESKKGIDQYLADLCAHTEECDPAEFAAEFGSVAACQDYFSDSLNDTYDLDDPICARSVRESLDCYVREFECGEYAYYVCEQEFEALEDDCADSFSSPPPVEDGDSAGDGDGDRADDSAGEPVSGTGATEGQ